MKFIITIGFALCFLSACSNDPHHTVVEGHQRFIVYAIKHIDSPKYGTYQYSVSDASGKGWTLKTFQRFALGDTLRIVKIEGSTSAKTK